MSCHVNVLLPVLENFKFSYNCAIETFEILKFFPVFCTFSVNAKKRADIVEAFNTEVDPEVILFCLLSPIRINCVLYKESVFRVTRHLGQFYISNRRPYLVFI